MTISTRTIAYHDGELPLNGHLAWDDASPRPRRGILLIHGAGGLDDHPREQASRYAALGYAVLACDMFGPGVAGNRERVVATLTGLRENPDQLVQRATAGVHALNEAAESDGCFAAVGFCFGGMSALTLARSGADLAGVVSMHGALATARRAQPGAMRAKVLACHGAIDPHVPMSDVEAFVDEMTAAGADWQLNVYGGAMHGFTHRAAVPGAVRGVEYHAPTDERSFAAARAFLEEVQRPAESTS